MKLKAIIPVAALAILAACGTPYRATDTNTFVVSSNAQSAFTTQYPNVSNVIWTNYDGSTTLVYDWDLAGWTPMDASDYVVRFDMDNENYYAWYDSDGTWIGTAYAVRDYSKLPASINTTLTTQYPAYTISTVNREFHKDRALYEIVMKKDDGKVVLLVDNDGTIIKSKVKPL